VLHLTNFIYIIFTVAAMFAADNYYLFVALIAVGSTFPPLGIRIAYTLGELADPKDLGPI
jgi:fructose-specific phosphotransferase system IIC component